MRGLDLVNWQWHDTVDDKRLERASTVLCSRKVYFPLLHWSHFPKRLKERRPLRCLHHSRPYCGPHSSELGWRALLPQSSEIHLLHVRGFADAIRGILVPRLRFPAVG